MIRQAIALIDVEHGVAAQKRNGSPFRRRLAPISDSCLIPFALGNETIGVADRDLALAFAYGAAKVRGLAKCEPHLRGEAALKQPPTGSGC